MTTPPIYSITSSAYVSLGTGPLTAVRKTAGDLLVSETGAAANDTDSFEWPSHQYALDYGGANEMFVKAKGAGETITLYVTQG